MQNPPAIQLLHLIKKTAVVLMLLFHLGRPSGETEIASLLAMDISTTRRALRSLEQAGFVIRSQIRNGYSLTEFSRQLFPVETAQNARFSGGTAQNARFAPASVINFKSLNPDQDQTVIESQTAQNARLSIETEQNARLNEETEQNARFSPEVGDPPSQPDNEGPPVPAAPVEKLPLPPAAVLAELVASGITLNKRTRSMAALPHITPEYIRAHRQQLKAQGKAGKTGLLITVLESGIPAPELNPTGHLKGCDCPECAPPGFSSLICPECYTHPCQCEEETEPEKPRFPPVLSALFSAGLPDNRITRSLADHPAITPELVSASREALKASFRENDPGKLFLLLEKAAREYERQPG
ncbi:MAG: MarR family transcriptional regulator [Omnitrophica WOR_2 bacterium]